MPQTTNASVCFLCGAPATDGYPDIAHTLRCKACRLAYEIGASADEAVRLIAECKDAEQVRRALTREVSGSRRISVIKKLETRRRQLAKEGGA